MSYYIRHLPWKKSHPQWKVQFVSYKKVDVTNSTAIKPKKEWDVPKERWKALGFHSTLTLEEARSRATQLNAQASLKRQEELVRKLELDRLNLSTRMLAGLPSEFVAEFEDRFIRRHDSETLAGKRARSRAQTLWNAAQSFVIRVGIDPSEWFFHLPEIYDYFYQREYSIRYTTAVLRMANLWGYFICRKLGRPFLATPIPRGYERQRIIDAYYKRQRTRRKASAPITHEMLLKTETRINRPNFNWIFLSIWFGLRPKEIDNLTDLSSWSVETLGNGREILWVFQTKLIALPPDDRWKPIPVVFEEQKTALEILRSLNFKRPLIKTIRYHFGDEVDLYGGRKGFSDLMLSREQTLENISIWMGHSTLDRTWRNYKSRKRFHLKGF